MKERLLTASKNRGALHLSFKCEWRDVMLNSAVIWQEYCYHKNLNIRHAEYPNGTKGLKMKNESDE